MRVGPVVSHCVCYMDAPNAPYARFLWRYRPKGEEVDLRRIP